MNKGVAYAKNLVCLAASRKTGGLCVAGKCIDTKERVKEWIRPVTSHADGTLLEQAVRYVSGGSPALLDILQIQFIRPQPHGHQIENHLIDPSVPWKKVGQFAVTLIDELVDDPSEIWIDGSSSSYGLNDTLSEAEAAKMGSSLLFIPPDKLSLTVNIEYPSQEYRRKKVRARIGYGRKQYVLAVTDPLFEGPYLLKDVGDYPLPASHYRLCVSLTEAFQGKCYKLVAGIVRL